MKKSIRVFLSKGIRTLKKQLRANGFVSGLYYLLRMDEIHVALFSRSYGKRVDKAIAKFAADIEDQDERRILKKDIVRSYYQCKSNPDEYFLLGFQGRDENYRKSFVTDRFLYMTMSRYVSRRKHDLEIEDKFNFYKLARPFFKRKAIKVSCSSDYGSFKEFAEHSKDLIIKPNDAAMGSRIFVPTIKSEDDINIQFQELISGGGSWIVEEMIHQSKEMAVWNESSVNTVRFLSFINKKKEFHALKPFLRTGRNGSVVDNAGSGGIFANVDVNSGKLSTCGIDEMGNRYEHHPDSCVKYEGWQIPRYDELVSTVRTMHATIMPDHPYIGWDMALTDEGWVVIECNWGQFVNQYIDHIGLKKEFLEYIN